MTAYEQLFAAVNDVVKHYRDDLIKHDKAWLEENPGVPFLHFAGECGTDLIDHIPADKYPARGVRVPYLFGSADREHILRGITSIVESIEKSGSRPVVHYFNGRELIPIDFELAKRVAQNYRRHIKQEWSTAEKFYA